MNRLPAFGIGLATALALTGAVVGFVWLPAEQQAGNSVWAEICSAAGLYSTTSATSAIVTSTLPTSRVAITPDMLDNAGAIAIGSGATLSLRCTMCHGANEPNTATTPHLLGQPSLAIYKQLRDFQTGARSSAVMAPLVAGLSDSEMRDLAAYFAFLPRGDQGPNEGTIPAIVASGAPMRGIASCGTCHGSVGFKAGAPTLDGQPEAYLRIQLQGFADGARHNDISQQMRNIARMMTAAEIEATSVYYAGTR